VDLEHLFNTEQLEGLHLDVMFAAIPKNLVADFSKKFIKRKTKNLFYTIFCVFLKESNQYVIFSSIFQTCKKQINNHPFKEILVDSVVFEEKQAVLNYIYDFIENFSEHDRLINEEIVQLKIMPAKEAFNYLLLWNQNVFSYFDELIGVGSLKKNRFFNLLK
jgi:hypothetical protein